MINNDFIQNLSRRAAELFPVADGVRRDLEQGLNELLQSSFSRLNLVSREEFDAQLAVLEKASMTIAELERKVAELERQVAERSSAAPAGSSPGEGPEPGDSGL